MGLGRYSGLAVGVFALALLAGCQTGSSGVAEREGYFSWVDEQGRVRYSRIPDAQREDVTPGEPDAKSVAEPADETVRVSRANAEARIAPTREGYVNAIQVWPFTDGALYQVYAAVGRVTEGPTLISPSELASRPLSDPQGLRGSSFSSS